MQENFKDFNPQVDQDAAIKCVLGIIFKDERLRELSCLLTEGHEMGAVEGALGWVIERRDTGSSGDMPGYVDWPENSYFHVYVEPRKFELPHPHMFLGIDEFHCCVRKTIGAYVAKNPSNIDDAKLVISHLKNLVKALFINFFIFHAFS